MEKFTATNILIACLILFSILGLVGVVVLYFTKGSKSGTNEKVITPSGYTCPNCGEDGAHPVICEICGKKICQYCAEPGYDYQANRTGQQLCERCAHKLMWEPPTSS